MHIIITMQMFPRTCGVNLPSCTLYVALCQEPARHGKLLTWTTVGQKNKLKKLPKNRDLGDLGCIFSAVWCINLPCVEVLRGLWSLEKRRSKAGVT